MITLDKNLKFGLLLDFYGGLLSPRQYEIMNYYYNEDLSLGEISDEIGISRQGVRDAVQKSQKLLTEFDEKLGLMNRFDEIKISVEEIKHELLDINVSKSDKNKIDSIIKKIDLIEF